LSELGQPNIALTQDLSDSQFNAIIQDTLAKYRQYLSKNPDNAVRYTDFVILSQFDEYLKQYAPFVTPKPEFINKVTNQVIKTDSFDSQLDKIIEIISNRALTNVGILLRFNTTQTAFSHSGNAQRSVQYVKDYFERKGITVEYKYNINLDTDMDLDFQSSNPKILTWWCAKGLQFKDVFVVDCNFDYIEQGETTKEEKTLASAWYVALSRTSERLFISYTDKLCDRFPVESSDLYANPINSNDNQLLF
jgi:superfamily I DNA/RNA helicase